MPGICLQIGRFLWVSAVFPWVVSEWSLWSACDTPVVLSLVGSWTKSSVSVWWEEWTRWDERILRSTKQSHQEDKEENSFPIISHIGANISPEGAKCDLRKHTLLKQSSQCRSTPLLKVTHYSGCNNACSRVLCSLASVASHKWCLKVALVYWLKGIITDVYLMWKKKV